MTQKQTERARTRKALRAVIRGSYAKVALGSKTGCCSGGCSCGGAAPDAGEAAARIGYSAEEINSVPEGANMGLGCGNPLALAELREGETVLDLGCGGGFDCFLASRRVGPAGRVIGVDMTPEMISLARRNAERGGYANVEFRLGNIESLPVENATADVILSNCVINLASDKRRAYREAFRALKPGGRLSLTDVLAFRPLPDTLRNDPEAVCGCVGGAELAETVRGMLMDAGFIRVSLRQKESGRDIVASWGSGAGAEEYVASYDIRAEKPAG